MNEAFFLGVNIPCSRRVSKLVISPNSLTLNADSLAAQSSLTLRSTSASDLAATPGRSTTAAATTSPYFSSGTPKQTASATSGWDRRMPSTWARESSHQKPAEVATQGNTNHASTKRCLPLAVLQLMPTSSGDIFSPPRLMSSLMRPVSVRYPSESIQPWEGGFAHV